MRGRKKQKKGEKTMKNLFKKLVAVVATVVMTVCATVAIPTEAKADTTKELFLEVGADATYSLGFWSPSGVTINADMASDGWTYLFTKVEDGLYKLELSLTDSWTATGLSLCVDGNENYKADPQWSGDAGAAAWTAFSEALSGSASQINISLEENDTQSTIAVKSTSDGSGSNEDATTENTTEETTSEETTSQETATDTVEGTAKVLYLEAETDATYSLGFWSPSGVTSSADMASDGWTYAFTKVEDGLYKLEFTLTADWTATGLSICVDGNENYKADPQWSGDAGAAAWTALTEALAGTDSEVHFKLVENDTQPTIELTSSTSNGSSNEDATTEEVKEESTTKAEEGTTAASADAEEAGSIGSILPIIIAVVVIATIITTAVVIMKKKR